MALDFDMLIDKAPHTDTKGQISEIISFAHIH